MKKLFKSLGLSFLTLALVVGASAGNANAATTYAVNAITETGALTINGAAASALTLGSAATTGAINVGSGIHTGSTTITSGTISGTTSTSGIVFSADAVTTGTAIYLTADALTSGEGMLLDHTTTVIENGGSLARLSSTSIDTSTTTGALLDLSSTASLAATQILGTFSGLTSGIGMSIVANALTTGEALIIPHTTSVIADGGSLLRLSSTSIDTGGATNGTLLDIGSTAQLAGTLVKVLSIATTGTVMDVTSTGIMTTTGNLLTLTGNSATTAAGLLRINANGLTDGIGEIIASSATASTATGRLFKVDHTGATSTSGIIAEFASAATDETNIVKITSAAMVDGVNLLVEGTTGMTTGSLIKATSSSAAALATNGIISFTSTGNFTSTSAVDGGFVEVKANDTTAGTVFNLVADALTTGIGMQLSNATSAMTSGSLLRVTTGGTGAIATNGIVSIAHSGIYTSTSAVNGGLLDVRAPATTAGVLVNVVAAGLITGQAVSISNGTAATTSGSLLRVAAGGTGAVSGDGIVSLLHTGIYTSSTVGFVNVNASATTAGTIMTVTGALVEDGTGLQISNAAITTGKHFNILGAAGASKFSISAEGATVIDGVAEGTAALTLTTGDILVSDGDIHVDAGDVAFDEDATVGGTLIVTGAATFTAGAQSSAAAVTATADGLTTGLIPAGTRYVTITAGADANSIVTLPAPVVGNIITAYIGATGVEVRTVALSNVKINNVDADGGAAEAALPATTLATFTAVSATEWILQAVDELGAVITAIVPDAV